MLREKRNKSAEKKRRWPKKPHRPQPRSDGGRYSFLMDEGNWVPTAQQVSERAGVGLRTVFRHFSDMEGLFVMADQLTQQQHQGKFKGGDRAGSLSERIEHAVERHADGYEATGHIILSTKSQLWRYPVLRKNYARLQHVLRKDLEDWLPELKSVPADQREMVDAAASFEVWHRLRSNQGLSKESSIDLVTKMLKALIVNY